jgi:hypothetical protein
MVSWCLGLQAVVDSSVTRVSHEFYKAICGVVWCCVVLCGVT